jgi:hypothetical protein
MKKGRVILLIACFLMACGIVPQPTATIPPTAVPTETSIPEPTITPTFSPTPEPTITSTLVPTVAFYAVDPTIAATASTCKADPDKICVSGLTILFTGRHKLDKYDVSVSYDGFSGTSFECPQQALLVAFGDKMAPVSCSNDRVTLISVGLTELTITITWGGGVVTETLRPNFEVSAPQGPNCKPQCLIGRAELRIP